MPKGREMENSPPHTPTMHRTTSVFTFLTSLGFGAHASDNVLQVYVVFCRCGDLFVYVYYVHECLYF